ncbi:hypothetical protein HKK52_29675 [Pseudomonas sp. ADAK2]|uniref:class I SAM-dependent methyltransferase n=1 Tax=unclassified Pseudomonas TaxID=196821 RepID=UPI0014640F1B|nr:MULTISPECIES: class I SAM-dependent methyltransferase [unclassified Pseudomonas]QJI44955.1 hypothetical protein HKK53_29675 [Pseudomonas sp. ADAK7]QJI51256.1 hypothetical protein HKK52_29675 [Pseudomonas sp. ADAK2]
MSSSEYSHSLSQLAINPRYISYPLSWLGHIPFAAWLIEVARPGVFVELGSYSGTSYFSFCQAVLASQAETKCFAIDTWEGDDHTGGYGESVYQGFVDYNDANFKEFSTYLRMRFEDANPSFQSASVDLLHIDGLHTYDAVKLDFETWLPKMSSRGIILFHDTTVEKEGFGVNTFWGEVSKNFPSFNFSHSNGLGVLLVGDDYQHESTLLIRIKDVSLLVERLAERLWLQQIVREKEDIISKFESTLIPEYLSKISDADIEKSVLLAEKEKLNNELESIKSSRLWRLATMIDGFKKRFS